MKKVIILVSVVVALLIGSAGFLYAFNYANDFNRTYIAFKNTFVEKNKYDTTLSMKISIDSEKYGDEKYYVSDEEIEAIDYISSILENASFNVRTVSEINDDDPKKNRTLFTTFLNYSDETLWDVVIYSVEEEIGFLSTSMMNKLFFIDKEELEDRLKDEYDIDLNDFDYKVYKDVIKKHEKDLKKVDEKKYEEIIKEHLEDKIEQGDKIDVKLASGDTVSCREYTITLNLEDMVELFKDLCDELKDDEEYREYIKLVAIDILETMIETEDYERLDLTEEDIEEVIDELEDEFEDGYEEFFDQIDEYLSGMESFKELDEYEITIDYAIDVKNTIRQLHTSINASYINIDFTIVYNSFKATVDLKPYEELDRVNVFDYEDPEKVDELFEEIIVELEDILKNNKAIDLLIEDMINNLDMLSGTNREEIEKILDAYESNKDELIEEFIRLLLEGMNPVVYEDDYNFEDEELIEESTITVIFPSIYDSEFFYRDYIKPFEKMYEGLTIECEFVDNIDSSSSLRVSGLVDVVFFEGPYIASDIVKDMFEPLGSYDYLSNYYICNGDYVVDGMVYGLPIGTSAQGIIYNKKVFRDAGITEIPKTPEAFIEALRKIDDNTEAIPLYTAYNDSWILETIEMNAMTVAGDSEFENNVIKSDTPFAPGEPYYEIYKLLYDIAEAGLIDEDLDSSNYENMKTLLAEGSVGAAFGGTYFVEDIKQYAENPDDIGFMAFPYSQADGKTYLRMLTNGIIGVKSDSTNKELAMEYMYWLIDESDLHELLGMLPSDRYLTTTNPAYEALYYQNCIPIASAPASKEIGFTFDDMEVQTSFWSTPIAHNVIDCALGKSGVTFEQYMQQLNQRWVEEKATVVGE